MPRIKFGRKPRWRQLILEALEDRVVLSTPGQADVPHVPVALHLAARHQPGSNAGADESPAAVSWPASVDIAKAHPRPRHAPKTPAPHGPKPKKHHGSKTPAPTPTPTPTPTSVPMGITMLFTITGHVSGNVAFLDNGIPTVAPGPIAGAEVGVSGALQNGSATTDQQGNFTISNVVADSGQSIVVCASGLTHLIACQGVILSPSPSVRFVPSDDPNFSFKAYVTISFVLTDDPNAVAQRFPPFDGTGDGAVDQAGNQYHYLGRGEYYATIGGQIEYFLPAGPEDYYCAALELGYYSSDDQGNPEAGGDGRYFTCKQNNQNPVIVAIYQSAGGGVYTSVGTNGYYFKPLP